MRFNAVQLQGVGHTAWEVQITRIYGLGISVEWFSSGEGYKRGNIGVCGITLPRGEVPTVFEGTAGYQCCFSIVSETHRWGRGVEFVSDGAQNIHLQPHMMDIFFTGPNHCLFLLLSQSQIFSEWWRTCDQKLWSSGAAHGHWSWYHRIIGREWSNETPSATNLLEQNSLEDSRWSHCQTIGWLNDRIEQRLMTDLRHVITYQVPLTEILKRLQQIDSSIAHNNNLWKEYHQN